MKSFGVKYEICDIDTGEMLLDLRRKTFVSNIGIQGSDFVRERFLDLVLSGRNVSINISVFDSRYNLDDVENIFMRNKHLDGVF